MTRRLRLIVGLVFLGLAAAGGAVFIETRRSNSKSSDPRVESHGPAEEHNFTLDHPPIIVGDVPTSVFQIPVSNRSDATVAFGPLHCSCACSQSKLPKQSLAPGEAMTVALTVATYDRVGQHHFTCFWTDNRNRQWSAGVRVKLYRREQFEPDRINFGSVEPAERRSQLVHFIQYGGTDAELPPHRDFTAEAGDIALQADPAVVRRVADHLVCRETPITLSFVAPTQTGQGAARVVPAGPPRADSLNLPVQWTVSPAIEVNPSRLVILGKAHSTGPQRILLQSRQRIPFQVLSAEVSNPGLRASRVGAESPASRQVIELELSGMPLGRSMAAELIIRTDHPGAEVLSMPVSVLVLPKATENSVSTSTQ